MKSAKRSRHFLLGLMVFAATVAPWKASGAVQAPSQSKITIHMIGSYTSGANQIIAAHPRVLKILDTSGGMLQAARDFKAGTPDGKVVLRVYTTVHYNLTDNPAASGTDFWNRVLSPALTSLSAANKALIDYVEGPNECDSTPCWSTLQDAQWFNAFWVALAPVIRNAGYRPCAFSIPVGNPPGTIDQIHQTLDAIVPALRTCLTNGGSWSYHAYTGPYTTDVSQEIWYSLRYRQYYSYFASNYPDLVNLPIIFTEGGVDNGHGWNYSGNGDATKFENWLTWYDAQIKQDSYVLGCTLFEIGDPNGWGEFDVEPIAGWLANYIGSTTSAPAAPTGLSATPTNTQVILRWNSSAGATSYKVKRSIVNGSGYSVIATNTSLAYTNSGLTNGVTYYFVVSAVNSTGEGPNSSQVSATPQTTASPPTWDSRLTDLGIYYTETNVAAGTFYWKLISGVYEDQNQSGGNHNIYYKALDSVGNPIANQRCWAAYPTSNPTTTVELFTKGAVDGYLGDYAMAGNNWCPYYPQGPRGPYGAYVDGPSDQVWGMGMPCNLHVNYRLTWRWTQKPQTSSVPVIAINVPSLSAYCQRGFNASNQTFLVRNSGPGTLNYNVADDVNWMSVSPATGSSSGEDDLITAQFSSAALGTGVYTGTITITSTNASNSPQTLPVTLTVSPSNSTTLIVQDFETAPAWTSTFDAAWGGAATWSINSGGQSGNALVANRNNVAGSSAKAQVFNIASNTFYTISIYIRCPSSGVPYWAECAYKLGSFTAQDFDANVASWTMIKKFSDTGPNGNGDTWTQYSLIFNSGTETQISVGFKLGSTGSSALAVQWDSLRIQQLFLPAVTMAIAYPASNTLEVFFAEPVNNASATNRNNYRLFTANTNVSINSATFTSSSNALLSISAQAARADYTLSVSNVVPAAATTNIVAANGQVPVVVPFNLIGIDAATLWSYNQSGANQGTAWRDPAFNDSSWPQGAALLAYETAALPETIRTPLTTNSSKITFYFRRAFAMPIVTNPPITLRLRQVIDDGVAYYLNGADFFSVGISNQPLYWTNFASRVVPDATYEGPFYVTATNLTFGTNVLATEVHQNQPTSSDIVFGVAVDALVRPSQIPVPPSSLSIVRQGANYLLSWTGSGWTLECTPTLPPTWTPVTNQMNSYTASPTNSARFYRLRQ